MERIKRTVKNIGVVGEMVRSQEIHSAPTNPLEAAYM